MRTILLLALLLSFCARAQNALPALGAWREHLPYGSIIDVTASDNKVYAATPYSLFAVDRASGEIERLSRVAGLSETGVSAVRFDPVAQRLYIAYTNSNIDVLEAKGLVNIPDIKRQNVSGDKTIYNIYPDNSRTYLSTGLGVIVLDADRHEVRESWFLGAGGAYVRTNGFVKNNGFFYAATELGLKAIAVNAANPANFANWQTLSGSNGLSAAPARDVVALNGRTIVLQNDSIFVQNGTTWTLFFANGLPVNSIRVSENKLFVAQQQSGSTPSRVLVLNPDGSTARVLQAPAVISLPLAAISVNGEPWVADQFGGLSRWSSAGPEVIRPNSPLDVATGQLAVQNSVLWATAGSVNESWNYQYNRNGFFRFANGQWTNFNRGTDARLDTLLDFIAVAIDPRDESAWLGSYGGGLAHVKTDNSIEIFKQNAPIGATVGDPTSYRVAGLAFDSDNNLWMTNFGAAQQLQVRKDDGSWRSFASPFSFSFNTAAQIVIDENNQKWISAPLGNGLMLFNDNNTIDNPADDRWRMYRAGAGQGNLPSNEVMALARDKSGFIWVGTDNGVGVIQCPGDAFVTGCETVWPVVKEGGFANYLFRGQEVRAIAVDGADRKWMATASGVWLVSRDGDVVLAHYNEDNSPLLSNDVKSIAIDGATGEVYFGTAKGISSFRGAATEAEESKGTVLVYPNPVPAGYTGQIGIRGLPDNAIVKITELNGRLVYQARSLGGQAVWNGKDYLGRTAASGVYLVLAVNEDKTEKVVTKIVLVSR